MFETDKKTYRLGIDMGSTSLGWCMLELDSNDHPCGIIKMGVRIFPDGRDAKSKEPLSVARRGYRGQRRNLDRYLKRLKQLIAYLIEHGFLSRDESSRSDVFTLNPYMLRAKGLDDELQPSEFARALIHMAKRRGFKSNRKLMSDKKTAYTAAIENLKKGFAETGTRTLGEYLWVKYSETPEEEGHLRKPIKFRYELNAESPEPIFPLREMVEHEFDAIWEKQAQYSNLYSDEHKEALKYIVFYQRPLKIPPKGKCELLPNEERAPKAHPLFQEFRNRQDLNNMKLIGNFDGKTTELSQAQYDILFQNLNTRKEMSFESMRKLIFGKQAGDYRFNFETENRKKLLGNLTNCEIHQKDHADIASLWDKWDENTQNNVIEIVISDLDDEPSKQLLMDLGISPDIAEKLLNIHLPSDFCKLSLKAMHLVLPHMRQRLNFYEACKEVNLNHSLKYDGRIFDEGDLPYYGELLQRETIALNRKTGDENADEHGRINNPTVHVALNQLGKIVNALCKKYGSPKTIHIELARDIAVNKRIVNSMYRELGKKPPERTDKSLYQQYQILFKQIQAKNTATNDRIAKELKKISEESNSHIANNYENRSRYKLWEELSGNPLERRCVYTGITISIEKLFTREFEIEHILPKSRTYDDSMANKTISHYTANRDKKEMSPYEAFSKSSGAYRWDEIIARANKLPDNKSWRFQADAMERIDAENDPIGRMLNDTRYMSRIAKQYLEYVCGENNVICVNGKQTQTLRSKWGLNAALGSEEAKNRNDHRHHAIDAFVIGLIDRATLQKLVLAITRAQDRFIEKLDMPYPGFDHYQFTEIVNGTAVSFKPDHVNPSRLQKRNQTGGALVEETAYALVGPDPKNPKNNIYAVRKGISEISKSNYRDIADPLIRKEIGTIFETSNTDDLGKSIKEYTDRHNLKKIKLLMSMNPKGMIAVKNKEGKIFKCHSSGENLFADIYIADPYKLDCKWDIEIVNSYNAHQPDFIPQWKKDYPKGKKVMRVFKNDIIALDAGDGTRELRRVRKMTYGILYLREINITKKEKNKEDIGEQYNPNKLLQLRARKAGVDIIGRVFDPISNEP